MDSVVPLEMPYENRDRMARFYQSAFDWQTQMLGEDMGNYVLAVTTETSDAGPTKPGASMVSIREENPDWPMQYPSVVIAVDDVKRSSEKILAAGGKVLGEPIDMAGVGRYVSFVDPEGNRVGLLEPSPRQGRPAK